MTLERNLQRSILKRLARVPRSWWVKFDGSTSGVPDVLGCVYGRFVAMELKQEGRYPTKMQRYMMARIEQAGGIVGVVRSVEEALALVDRALVK